MWLFRNCALCTALKRVSIAHTIAFDPYVKRSTNAVSIIVSCKFTWKFFLNFCYWSQRTNAHKGFSHYRSNEIVGERRRKIESSKLYAYTGIVQFDRINFHQLNDLTDFTAAHRLHTSSQYRFGCLLLFLFPCGPLFSFSNFVLPFFFWGKARLTAWTRHTYLNFLDSCFNIQQQRRGVRSNPNREIDERKK